MAKSEVIVSFDTRSLTMMDRMAKALEHHNNLTIEIAKTGLTPSEDYYDEQTLDKVRKVLDSLTGSIAYSGTEIISLLQNEGILFRERRP